MRCKPLGRTDHVDPEKVNRDHEDERMDRSRSDRGLTAGENTTGTGWQGQKNTRAEHKEKNRNQKVEHLYYVFLV
jgi:hypothetical protein